MVKIDLDFISGKFLETEISKDKAYLLKYFRTEVQIAFLRYALVFENVDAFSEHTGFACTPSYLYKMNVKYRSLVEAHRSAKKDMDLALLWEIESGKYKV